MSDNGLGASGIIEFGPLAITDTVVTTWVIVLAFAVSGVILRHRLAAAEGTASIIAESIYAAMEEAIRGVLPHYFERVGAFIMTLWILLVVANLVGVIPGLHSPTRDLSATAALAVLVFLSVHWFGIRIRGIRGYLRHYLLPNPILLPFHIVSEVTRTLALAIRLFGNMMSMELIALLLLLVAGFLVPVPILMLHIVEALVQAYIFGMLALIYIAGGVQLQKAAPAEKNKHRNERP